MIKIFCCLLLFLRITSIYSQVYDINGIVIDKSTSLPIAYASVGIQKLGIGTVTNQEGKFILHLSKSIPSEKLSISFIGYKTFTESITNIHSPFVCQLQADTFMLNEIIIQPDTLTQFLRKVYFSISKNYSSKPVMYEGFYRETQRVSDSVFLDFNEAILRIYKKTYTNNTNLGQIKIVNSRKNIFPGIDTINPVRFYGGPHFPIVYDFVFSRMRFINPSYFKKYNYTFLYTTSENNKEICVIKFEPKESALDDYQGKLFIDKESLAYIGAEFIRPSNMQNKRKFRSPQYHYDDATFKIRYYYYANTWHLKNIQMITSGYNKNTQKRVLKEIEYVTTSVQTDSVEPIPYNEEFGYYNILSIDAKDYSESNWKDYTILQRATALDNQVKTLYANDKAQHHLQRIYRNQEPRPIERIYKVLNKLSFDFSLIYIPVEFKSGLYSLSYTNEKTISTTKNRKGSDFQLEYASKISYFFNRHVAGYLSMQSNLLSGQYHEEWEIGLKYRSPLFSPGRLFFEIYTGYGTSVLGISTGKVSNEGTIQIDHKNFNASEIEMYIGNKKTGIRPEISFSYKTGKRMELFTSVSYMVCFQDFNIVRFKDNSGFFLTRKSSILPVTDSHIELTRNGTITTSVLKANNFQFGCGVRLIY